MDAHTAAAPNVIVAVRSYIGACPANATGAGGVTALTDATGHYRVQLPTGVAPAIQCIAATAGTGSASSTVAGAMVQFKDMDDTPYDSVRTDIHLP